MAVLTKIIGCGLGAKICRMSNHESLVVGVGMVARGRGSAYGGAKGMRQRKYRPKVFPAIVLLRGYCRALTPCF